MACNDVSKLKGISNFFFVSSFTREPAWCIHRCKKHTSIYQYTKNALIFFLMFDLKIVFGYTRWEGSATDS